MNKIYFFFCIVFFSVLYASEISVFGAGDISSNMPYGLTKAEKAAYKNSKKIESLIKKLNRLEDSYEDLTQNIDGIKSVYENDSKNIYKAKKNIKVIAKKIESSSNKLSKQIQKNSSKIELLELKLDKFISLQQKNNKFAEEKLIELANAINKINSNYVKQKQFDELVQFVNKQATKKSVKKVSQQKNQDILKKSNKELMSYAKSLYRKNYITKSLPLFKVLVERKYRPAENNYYLGKAYFYKKKYKNAIHHFKSSMMLYDQAKWIPELLLLSAISFEKIGDKENAVNFYNGLIDAYPETKEAKQASKKLEKLQ